MSNSATMPRVRDNSAWMWKQSLHAERFIEVLPDKCRSI